MRRRSRYIARRLGPDAADDLVAETFLAAFRKRGRYDSAQADARPRLYGIATRLIGRHQRDEVRFFRAIARTGVDPAAEPVADQVTDRVAAQAASRELAAAAVTPKSTTAGATGAAGRRPGGRSSW